MKSIGKRFSEQHRKLEKLPNAAIKIPYRIIFEGEEIDCGIARPPLIELCRKYDAKVVDAYISKAHEIVYLLRQK